MALIKSAHEPLTTYSVWRLNLAQASSFLARSNRPMKSEPKTEEGRHWNGPSEKARHLRRRKPSLREVRGAGCGWTWPFLRLPPTRRGSRPRVAAPAHASQILRVRAIGLLRAAESPSAITAGEGTIPELTFAFWDVCERLPRKSITISQTCRAVVEQQRHLFTHLESACRGVIEMNFAGGCADDIRNNQKNE